MVAVVQHASTTHNFTSGTSGTVSPAFASNITPGNTVVACITMSNDIGATSVTAVTTNGAAENWAQAVTDANGVSAGWWDKNSGGGQTVINVTVAFGGTATASDSTAVTVDIFEISGLGAAPTLDQVNSADAGPGTTWSSGNITTTSASEIVFGCNNGTPLSGASFTQAGPGAPWTNETALTITGTQGGGSIFYSALSGFDILTSTGTTAYAGTSSTSVFTSTIVFSIAAAAGGGPTPSPLVQAHRLARGSRQPGRARLQRPAQTPLAAPAPVIPRRLLHGPPAARAGRTARAVQIPAVAAAPATPSPLVPFRGLKGRPAAARGRLTAPRQVPPVAAAPVTPSPLVQVHGLARGFRARSHAVMIRISPVIPVIPVIPSVPVSGADRFKPWRHHGWPVTPIGIPYVDIGAILGVPDRAEVLPPDTAELAPGGDAGEADPLRAAGPGFLAGARAAAADRASSVMRAAAAATARTVPDSGAVASPAVGEGIAYWQQHRKNKRKERE